MYPPKKSILAFLIIALVVVSITLSLVSKSQASNSPVKRSPVAAATSKPLPKAPFNQCPPVGSNSGCAILLYIDENGSLRVLEDPAQGPYDNIEDTLIGVQNDWNKTVLSIPLKSVLPIFAFDGDGLCNSGTSPRPAGCPFGPTEYEGPGVSFSSISADHTSGVINFANGIPPGGSSYFSLEERISTSCFPIFGVPDDKQFDAQWADEIYDHYSPKTIKNKGCNLTSCANVINYQANQQNINFSTDPSALNTWLSNQTNGYDKHHGVNPYEVARYARDVGGVSLYYGGTIGNRNDFILDSYLCTYNPVVLSVPGHFILATGQTTINGISTYSINDPGHSDRKTLEKYNYTYSGLRLYGSIPASLAGLFFYVYSPVEILVTDPSGQKTGYSLAPGGNLQQIPNSSYYEEFIADDVDPSTDTDDEKTKRLEILSPISGKYTLELIGIGTGPYALDIIGYNLNGSQKVLHFSGQATPGSSSKYIVNYSSTDVNALTADPSGLPDGIYKMIATSSNKCIQPSVAFPTSGIRMVQNTCSNANEQKWQVQNLGDNIVRLTNVATGLSLEVAGGLMIDYAPIDQGIWTGADHQKWRLRQVGNAFELTSVKSSFLMEVLGVPYIPGIDNSTLNQVPLDQHTSTGGANQRFIFQ